jgi:hypothetical protein
VDYIWNTVERILGFELPTEITVEELVAMLAEYWLTLDDFANVVVSVIDALLSDMEMPTDPKEYAKSTYRDLVNIKKMLSNMPATGKITFNAPLPVNVGAYDFYIFGYSQHYKSVDASAGRIGISWASGGGESSGLITVENYLACDGIENVIRVLNDLEDNKFRNLEFVELNACPGGCVGGVLTVENPFIAKTKLKAIRKYMPVSMNNLGKSIPNHMLWDTELVYNPVFELEGSRMERFRKYSEMERLIEELPGLDCGFCGAPTCKSFADDVVRGYAKKEDCAVLMRRKLDKIKSALE